MENRQQSLVRFDGLVGRLHAKMGLSQTPVPGFIVGLSGTDSILAFLLVYEAAVRMGIGDRVLGIHYASARRRKPTWFEDGVVPWLRERCPKATILVTEPLGGNHDQQRWADLHLRALNDVVGDETGNVVVSALPAGRNYWVVGCTNLTEFELGKFSAMSERTSVAPLRKVWKSKVLAMCEALDVPSIAIEYSRLPDCLCGRDDIAANNIELIDAILTHEVRVREHDPDLLDMMFAYVRDLKRENGFKQRTPYLL
jgi:NH3-dependent NAD+ synthetase